MALEGVVRRAGVETSGTISTKSVQILAYADDVDIVGRVHLPKKQVQPIGLHEGVDRDGIFHPQMESGWNTDGIFHPLD
jgi:hypothetical protein